jgi:hypothetical protein
MSKWRILLGVLGLPAGITALLVGAPVVGPWIVGALAIVGGVTAVMAGRSAGRHGYDADDYSSHGASDSTSSDGGGGSSC